MKKVSAIALGILILTSCGKGGFAPGFDVSAGVSGSNVEVTIVYERDDSGNLTVKENNYVLTQPTVTFITKAGSLGGVVRSAEISVSDGSGNTYAGQAGRYTQSFSAAIPAGWACTTENGVDLEAEPVGCPNTSLVPVQRVSTQNLTISQLISPQVAEELASDCAGNFGCTANVKANIIFKAVDTQGVNHDIPVYNVPISVYVTSSTEEGQ